MRSEGFRCVQTRDAYVRKFAAGLQLAYLRLLVVAGVVRLELSAAARFEGTPRHLMSTSGKG